MESEERTAPGAGRYTLTRGTRTRGTQAIKQLTRVPVPGYHIIVEPTLANLRGKVLRTACTASKGHFVVAHPSPAPQPTGQSKQDAQ